jgi:glycosyltransferase involved in cell wall biosynthesis
MKISVITVVYNCKDYIEQTILSVLNQTYQNIEYIIIDGNSTDGTTDLIKKYESKLAYWISEPDSGIYDAMNKGIDKATGDWFYFLGAGDILINILQSLVPKLVKPNTIYYGNVYRTDIFKVFDGYFSSLKMTRKCICHQAIIYPASSVKKYKYQVEYKVQADHNLNLKIHGDKQYSFKYINIIFCIYEGGGYSFVTRDKLFASHRLKIVKRNFSVVHYWTALIIDKIYRLIKRGEYRKI